MIILYRGARRHGDEGAVHTIAGGIDDGDRHPHLTPPRIDDATGDGFARDHKEGWGGEHFVHTLRRDTSDDSEQYSDESVCGQSGASLLHAMLLSSGSETLCGHGRDS